MTAPPSNLERRHAVAEEDRAQHRRHQRLEVHVERGAERADPLGRDIEREDRRSGGEADADERHPAERWYGAAANSRS